MQAFIGSLLLFFSGLIMFFAARGQNKLSIRISSIIFIIIGLGMFVFSTVYEVDEGEAYVLTQFGKVQTTTDEAGLNFKMPWWNAYPFPTRLRAYTIQIDVRSSDGLKVEVDVTTRLRVNSSKLSRIYREIAKTYDVMEDNIIRPTLRKAIRDTMSVYSARNIYEKRSELSGFLTEDAKKELEQKYIIVDELLLRNIVLPPETEKNIQVKVRKQQEAEAMEFEKEKSRKQAEIRKIEAQGIAEAQAIINKTLSQTYLQHEAIEAYKSLAKSSNTTFIIMPTSPNSTGMPLINVK